MARSKSQKAWKAARPITVLLDLSQDDYETLEKARRIAEDKKIPGWIHAKTGRCTLTGFARNAALTAAQSLIEEN